MTEHLTLSPKDAEISPNHYLYCVSQQRRKVVSREANPLFYIPWSKSNNKN